MAKLHYHSETSIDLKQLKQIFNKALIRLIGNSKSTTITLFNLMDQLTDEEFILEIYPNLSQPWVEADLHEIKKYFKHLSEREPNRYRFDNGVKFDGFRLHVGNF